MTLLLSSFLGGASPPPTPPFFLLWHLLRHVCLEGTKKLSFFLPFQKCPPCNIAFFQKKWLPPIFSGNAIKIGVFEDFEKPDFLEKKVELLPAHLEGPHFWGVTFFFGLFFFFVLFLFLLHVARGCAKKTLFL